MPSYGEKQKPAGVDLGCKLPMPKTRVMVSNNSTITPTLKRIDNIPYKGILSILFSVGVIVELLETITLVLGIGNLHPKSTPAGICFSP